MVLEHPAVPSLAGVVRTPAGVPVPSTDVVCLLRFEGRRPRMTVDLGGTLHRRGASFEHRRARTDADGAYRFARLPPGEWIVFAGGPGTDWTAAAIEVVTLSGSVRQDLVVRRGSTLEARLVTSDGSTCRGDRVRFTVPLAPGPVSGDIDVVAAADGDGRVVVPGLPSGPWKLFFDHRRTTEPRVVEEAATEVEIRFP